MRVICDRGTLVDALGLMGSVAVQRTPKPVLSCVKVVAGEDGLTLTATDLEVSLTLNALRVEVEQPGEALIPADKLSQIVRESIDPTLTMTTEGEVVQITGQDSKYRIYSQAVSDFPAVPTFDEEPHFEMVAGDLHRLVAMTIFATARENSRYAINGVLMERDGKNLTVVATDGHRLAMAKGKAQAAAEGGQSAIVPTKALQLLLRLFDDAEQVVKVRLAGNRVLFTADHATLTSSLVEGNFPPYRDVIPKDGDKKATLTTDVFISAVRRAALLTNEESKGVRMAYSPDGLTLSSRAPEMGEAEINVELAGYDGEPIEIGFNPAYLLDALKVMDDKQVQFDFKASNKPGVLRTGPDFLYVVMPVNLQ
ncbi:MAG: DNA polymerase III subunit beta [Planctomycetota bacterium]